MVFGFPGRTTEYLIYEAARQQVDVLNPVRISLRDKALKIMDKYMRADEKTKFSMHQNMQESQMHGKNGSVKILGCELPMD